MTVQEANAALVAANHEYEEAQKNAKAHEDEARRIRNVDMPSLKEKRMELALALTNAKTLEAIESETQAAQKSRVEADKKLAEVTATNEKLSTSLAELETQKAELAKLIADAKEAADKET